MSVDQYVEMFHARNGFSRQRMDAQSAAEFDTAVRELVAPFATEQVLTFDVTTNITWGHPALRNFTMSYEGRTGSVTLTNDVG